MSSSIHYKFKSTLQYKTLEFEGIHITVEELKRVICEVEKIKSEAFDFKVTNAHTKREYGPNEYVPRNCSVVIQRTPRENAAKLPKVQDTSTSGIVTRGTIGQEKSMNLMAESDFSKLSEEQRLAFVKEVSYQKYQPSNYNRRAGAIMSGPPPPTYICNRCYQHGHWLKNCPMTATKRTTGIPMEELMETTKDDKDAWYHHPSGKYVVPIMHYQARQQRKQEALPGATSTTVADDDDETSEIPAELACPLCQNLLREAVLTTCCGDSYCAECIQQRVLDDDQEHQICPNPECHQRITADLLVPNNNMRLAVQKFLTNSSGAGSSASLPVSGANKPDLFNTNSLLHKVLPDLTGAGSPMDASLSPSQYLKPMPTASTVPPTTSTVQPTATLPTVTAAPSTLVGGNSAVPFAVGIPPYATYNIPPPNLAIPPPNFPPPPLATVPAVVATPTPLPSAPTSTVAGARLSPPPTSSEIANGTSRPHRRADDCVIPGETSHSRSNGAGKLDDSNASLSLAWESLLRRDEKTTGLSNLFNRDDVFERTVVGGRRSSDRERHETAESDRRKRGSIAKEERNESVDKYASKRFKVDAPSERKRRSRSRDRHYDESRHSHVASSSRRDRHRRSRDNSSTRQRRQDRSRERAGIGGRTHRLSRDETITEGTHAANVDKTAPIRKTSTSLTSRDTTKSPNDNGIKRPTGTDANSASRDATEEIEPKSSDVTLDDDDEEDQIERIIRETKEMKRKAAEKEAAEKTTADDEVAADDGDGKADKSSDPTNVDESGVHPKARVAAALKERTPPAEQKAPTVAVGTVRNEMHSSFLEMSTFHELVDEEADLFDDPTLFPTGDSQTVEEEPKPSSTAATVVPSDALSKADDETDEKKEAKTKERDDDGDRFHRHRSSSTKKDKKEKKKKKERKVKHEKETSEHKKEQKKRKDYAEPTSSKKVDKEKKRKKESKEVRRHHRDDDNKNNESEKRSTAKKHKKKHHHRREEERNGGSPVK